MITRYCKGCNQPFTSENNSQRYCTLSCRYKAQRQRKNVIPNWRNTPVICGICGKEFIRPENSSPIRKYCSDECIYKARNKQSADFKKANPEWFKNSIQKRLEKNGTDSLSNRVYRKHPDLPKVCEVPDCEENRVLDFAHKPQYARKGAYRLMKFYERQMFWVLCPTHHAIIDRGVLKPSELGLIE